MIFESLPLAGASLVLSERSKDSRGWFARVFSEEDFARHGRGFELVQASVAHNESAGTVRGLHFQAHPHEEAKLVQCVKGAVYDVIVDLRPDSATYCRWCSVELSEERTEVLFVPRGLAHGYQTLVADTTLLYMMSTPYAPGSVQGVRWDDPLFSIDWPPGEKIMSERDRLWPDYRGGTGE